MGGLEKVLPWRRRRLADCFSRLKRYVCQSGRPLVRGGRPRRHALVATIGRLPETIRQRGVSANLMPNPGDAGFARWLGLGWHLQALRGDAVWFAGDSSDGLASRRTRSGREAAVWLLF